MQFGKIAMHYAATYGFVHLLGEMAGHAQTAINEQDLTGQTPLHCAAIQGETLAAKACIDLGAKVDAR